MKCIRYVLMILVFIVASCKDDQARSSLAILEEFAIKEFPDIEFTIDANNQVKGTTPEGSALNSLTAVFSISPKATMYVGAQQQGSGSTKKDFTNTVLYKVVAEDGISNQYAVNIYTDIIIKSFGIQEMANVSFAIQEGDISATVINGTSLDNLTAKFTISSNSKLYLNGVEQISGETQNDFTQQLEYNLISDKGIEKKYILNINEADNQPPIANAGADKTYYLGEEKAVKTITLDGSLSSDEEGSIAAYEWKLGGVVISNQKTEEVGLAEGEHEITLTVTDSKGLMSSDVVIITVLKSGSYKAIDLNANPATQNLLSNLGKIANSSQFIFGQEFPLSFKLNGLRSDLGTSDCKDVTGDHPGVYGIDPHYMLYKSPSEKQLHIDEAKKAYQSGAVVTLDFHQQSRSDHKIYMSDISTDTDKSLLYDIVNDKNGSRTWFFEELDEVLSIINNDFGFPVVFRLFHEMDGDWFWWGSDATNHSSDLYVNFYRLAADYIMDRTNWVLFAWSPNYVLNEAYYPGDEYVDIVGIDLYEPSESILKSNLIELSKFAFNHNKIAALTETGYRKDFINTKPDFWNEVVLKGIKNGGKDIKIAWALAWFNAPWANDQSDLFIPDSNSPQNVKNEFVLFKEDPVTLFQEDVGTLNLYE